MIGNRWAMSRGPFGLCLIAAAGLAPCAGAATFEEWKFKGEVKAPAGTFVALPLTPRLFDSADKADLSDLRLVDPTGTEVPYAIIREKETREEADLPAQILNRENPTPAASRLTVDFASAVVKDRITVSTAGNNFRRAVRVEGSSDQVTWAEVATGGWLFAVGFGEGKRFETLDLGANTYRYLRITVTKMSEEDAAPAILEVTCRRVVVQKPEETAVTPDLLEYTTDPQFRASMAVFDFKHRHLPVARLKLVLASDPQRVFRRQLTVWGRNSLVHTERVRFETEERGSSYTVPTEWTRLESGVIFRDADGRESLELSLDAPFRYLKVMIENGDSPPLDLGGGEAVRFPVQIVFEPAGQSRLTLYTGNPEAPVPQYEAAATLAKLDVRRLPRIGEVVLAKQDGPQKEETPGGQPAVWVLMAAATAATVILLWLTAAAVGKKDGRPGDGSGPPPRTP